jgi:hypothetical protein
LTADISREEPEEEIKFEPEPVFQDQDAFDVSTTRIDDLDNSLNFPKFDRPEDPVNLTINPDSLKENFKHYVDGIPNNNDFFDRLYELETLDDF